MGLIKSAFTATPTPNKLLGSINYGLDFITFITSLTFPIKLMTDNIRVYYDKHKEILIQYSDLRLNYVN